MIAERAPGAGISTPGRNTLADELDDELEDEQLTQQRQDGDEQVTQPAQARRGSVFDQPYREPPLTLDEDDDELPTTTKR